MFLSSTDPSKMHYIASPFFTPHEMFKKKDGSKCTCFCITLGYDIITPVFSYYGSRKYASTESMKFANMWISVFWELTL